MGHSKIGWKAAARGADLSRPYSMTRATACDSSKALEISWRTLSSSVSVCRLIFLHQVVFGQMFYHPTHGNFLHQLTDEGDVWDRPVVVHCISIQVIFLKKWSYYGCSQCTWEQSLFKTVVDNCHQIRYIWSDAYFLIRLVGMASRQQVLSELFLKTVSSAARGGGVWLKDKPP